MDKIEMVKGAGEFIVSVGVAKIVTNIVNTTMPANIGIPVKFCVAAGSFVLSNMATEAAVDHVEKKFDAGITEIKKILEKRDSNEKEKGQ